jgi:hypothetical protein
MLKHFNSRRRNIKSLKQLSQMKEEDRRSLLRSVSDEQYKDIMRVLSLMPNLRMSVTTEVVDDEEQHVVTAGAIITVTILITRFPHFVFRQMQEVGVQCCGSGIRCLLNPWIRDEHFRFHFRELRNNFLVSKILKFFDADPDPGSGFFLTLDPGSGMEKIRIRINIPAPQHWWSLRFFNI